MNDATSPLQIGPGSGVLMHLELSALEPDPDNVREKLTGIADLAASLKQDGVLQPLLVKESATTPGRYRIIDGHRRYAAAELARLPAVPAMVSSLTDHRAKTAQLVANIQREDLSAVEIAEALSLMATTDGSATEIAALVGKPIPWVRRHLALLNLPPKIFTAIKRGRLGYTQAEAARKVFENEGLDAALVSVQGMATKELSRRTASSGGVAKTKREFRSTRGDLSMRLIVEYPVALTPEQETAIERQLRALAYSVPEGSQA